MESALMTTPAKSHASLSASADFPLAVGPATTSTGRLCAAATSLISALAMTFVLSLICAPDAAELTPALLERVNHGLDAAAARVQPALWLDPERAIEIAFDGDGPAALTELRRR